MTSDSAAHRVASSSASVGGGRRAGGIRAQQVPGDDAEVHLVGSVGQAQAARAGVGGGEREVVAHAAAAVQLDREVDDVAGHLGHGRLDLGHLGLGALDADGVELPRGVQHEQAGLVDRDPGAGEPLAVAAEVGDRLAEGDPARRALAGQLERLLGQADEPHAVVHAAGAEPALRDLERPSRAGEDRGAGSRTAARLTSPWPSGSSYWPSAVSRRSTFTPGASSGTRTIECRRCRGARGVGEAHEDADLAVGVAGTGRPPLAAVEHDVVAVEGGGGPHVRGVGAGDARLGHEERAAHPTVEERLEPLLLLLGRAVAQQHLHVAGVGGVAVEDQGRQRASDRSARRRRRSRCCSGPCRRRCRSGRRRRRRGPRGGTGSTGPGGAPWPAGRRRRPAAARRPRRAPGGRRRRAGPPARPARSRCRRRRAPGWRGRRRAATVRSPCP